PNANEATFQRCGALARIRIIKNWQILRLAPAAELPQLGLNCAANRSFSFRTGGAIYGWSGLEISHPRGAAGRRVVRAAQNLFRSGLPSGQEESVCLLSGAELQA